MRRYIVTCKTPDGDLKERHVEARNHLAAVKAATDAGFTVVSIDRDDDGERPFRSHKRLKRVIGALLAGLFLAGLCVAAVWWRYIRHG